MKIIHNKFIPFKGYKAINLFGIVFVRDNIELNVKDTNHEYIHTQQYKELLWLGFLPVYCIEYLVRLILTKSFDKAYRSISFEQEAYDNQCNLDYNNTRKHFAWLKYFKSNNK